MKLTPELETLHRRLVALYDEMIQVITALETTTGVSMVLQLKLLKLFATSMKTILLKTQSQEEIPFNPEEN